MIETYKEEEIKYKDNSVIDEEEEAKRSLERKKKNLELLDRVDAHFLLLKIKYAENPYRNCAVCGGSFNYNTMFGDVCESCAWKQLG